MPLSSEEFRGKTIKILADPANIADMSVLLSEIVDDHITVIAERDAANNLAADLRRQNDELIKTNMALYLKTAGAPAAGEQAANPNEEPKKPEYSDLFDDSGRLQID